MLQTIFRTIFFYFFITIAYRIMGKREVGQLGIIDLIVSILIAELVAISIENYKDSLSLTIGPIIVLVILEIVLGYISIKSRKFSKLMGGKPAIIISHGKLNYNVLVSQRLSLDDLLLQLREKEIRSIEDVEYAFLETNGKLSIFKYGAFKIKRDIPMPVIVEGVIQKEILAEVNKSEEWLLKILHENNLDLNQVFYALVKKNSLYIIKYNNA